MSSIPELCCCVWDGRCRGLCLKLTGSKRLAEPVVLCQGLGADICLSVWSAEPFVPAAELDVGAEDPFIGVIPGNHHVNATSFTCVS